MTYSNFRTGHRTYGQIRQSQQLCAQKPPKTKLAQKKNLSGSKGNQHTGEPPSWSWHCRWKSRTEQNHLWLPYIKFKYFILHCNRCQVAAVLPEDPQTTPYIDLDKLITTHLRGSAHVSTNRVYQIIIKMTTSHYSSQQEWQQSTAAKPLCDTTHSTTMHLLLPFGGKYAINVLGTIVCQIFTKFSSQIPISQIIECASRRFK